MFISHDPYTLKDSGFKILSLECGPKTQPQYPLCKVDGVCWPYQPGDGCDVPEASPVPSTCPKAASQIIVPKDCLKKKNLAVLALKIEWPLKTEQEGQTAKGLCVKTAHTGNRASRSCLQGGGKERNPARLLTAEELQARGPG